MRPSAHTGDPPGFVHRFGGWWQTWSGRCMRMTGLDACSADKPSRIAREIDVGRPELRVLASKWPDADQLSNRMGTGQT